MYYNKKIFTSEQNTENFTEYSSVIIAKKRYPTLQNIDEI